MYYLNYCRFDFKGKNSNMHYPLFMAKCISWQFQLYKLIFMAFICCFFFNRNFKIVIKYIVIIFAFLKVIRYFCEKKIEKFSTSNFGDLDFKLNVLWQQKKTCSTKCFEFFKKINIIMNCITSMHMSNI